MNDISLFTRQVQGMCSRLEHLYARASEANSPQPDLLSPAIKELGIAAEELQVASEELHQQSEQMNLLLQDAAEKYQYYQEVFKCISEPWLITDLVGKIQDANPVTAELLNTSREFLIGNFLINFIPVQERPTFRNQLNLFSIAKCLRQSWLSPIQLRHNELVNTVFTASIIPGYDSERYSLHWSLQNLQELWTTIAPEQQNGSVAALPCQTPLENRPIHLFERGDIVPLDPQSLWQVRKGIVKLTTFSEDNNEILLGLAKPSMVISIGSTALPVYQAIASSTVQLVRFSMEEIEASPALAQALLPQMNQRMQQTEAFLAASGQRHVQDRLHQLLRVLRQEIGHPVDGGHRLAIRLTHEELASACCTTRVTVTRLLGDLQRQQKIKIDSQSHIILSQKF